jgi:hypothetical protein
MGPTSLLADLGVAYRFGEGGGWSAPMGLDLQVWAINAFVSADTGLGGGYVGGGFRLPPPDRQLGCVAIGRPLHDEQGQAELPSIRALGESAARSELESAIVGEWGERARSEWASVPAFLQLADQLLRAGAPRALVQRAWIAAEDEARHAVLTARVAVRIGGAPVHLSRVTPATRAPAQGRDALVRLAVESWVDGCLGEGRAAAIAARESAAAEVETLRDVQGAIARDEGRHAELAWDVLAWAVRAGGDDVRHAVDACREAAPPAVASEAAKELDLEAFGLLSPEDQDLVGEETRDAARVRLSALLS